MHTADELMVELLSDVDVAFMVLWELFVT